MSPASVASILKCGKILLHCALGDAVPDRPSFRRNADLLQKRFQRDRRNTNRRPPSLKASEDVLLRANDPQSCEVRARSRTDGGVSKLKVLPRAFDSTNLPMKMMRPTMPSP